jgi:hypothetical protein
MSLKRSLATGTAVVLTALSLTGCGGGAPDDAATEDFCEVWNDDRGNTVDDAHDSAEKLEEVGTPEDFDETARDGFEIFVEVLAAVDQDDIEAMDQAAADSEGAADVWGVDQDEAADVLAFFEYANETCSGAEEEPTE